MKRLVFVNSNTKVSKIKDFMRMKGIEKYTLLESSQDFREELLVNSADIYIFDFYGDVRIIESLMDFIDHVNDLYVYAESIRIGKMYSRLSPNIFVLPNEVDLFLHFWETPSCELRNAILCDSCGKPPLHVRKPEGLIIKTKKMQVRIDQAHIPVSYMDGYGKVQKGKAAQLQVTLKPRGLFTKAEGMVRHQPKFGEKMEALPQPEIIPIAKEEKPPKPAPVPKPPKPPKPVREKPPKPVKPPKPPKVVEEPAPKYVEANAEGSGEDAVRIDAGFDNQLSLLETATVQGEGPTAEELQKAVEEVVPEPAEETLPEPEPEPVEEILPEPEPEPIPVLEQEEKPRGILGGLFGGKKKKEKGGFFEQSDVEFGSSEDLMTEGISYQARAFRAKIITKIDEYLVVNGYINSEQKNAIQAEMDTRMRDSGAEVRFGDLALEMGFVTAEQYCEVVAGFRNIEILQWAQLKNLPVVVDRFDRGSYERERFFETSPTADGRVRIIASVNSTAIDEKIRKYAENSIIQYTIDAYITQKLQEP